MDNDKRSWLMDILTPDTDSDYDAMCDDIRDLTDMRVDRMIERLYDGGLATFALDSAPVLS